MIDGYCWPQSGRAGDEIKVFVSSPSTAASLVVSRIGAESVAVLEQQLTGVGEQPVSDNVGPQGCAWEPTTAITIDPEWQSGFYLVELTVGTTTSEAFFVVKASEPGDTLLVLSTSTWAAYNDWGGPSFYTGGHVSSMQRPLPRGFLKKPNPHRYRVARAADLERDDLLQHFSDYSYWSSAAGWANWECLFVRWAEQVGLDLDYATSLDLHQDPQLLAPYKRYVSVGHDEYWSASMRDGVETWTDHGGHAVFLSGNTAFWQVRFEGDDTQVVGYKNDYLLDPVIGTDAEHTVSTMWSDPLCKRPEAEMTGVSFTRGGYAHCRSAPRGSGGYTVWRPEHRAFDGLALRAGDIIGAEPVVVGYECDGTELQLIDGRPAAVGSGGTPANFEVLGTAPAHLWETNEAPPGLPDSYIGELNWVAERLGGGDTPENRARFAYGNAVMGTYRRGAGEVFTVGCTDWAYGLHDPAISQITRNLLFDSVASEEATDPATTEDQ